MVAELMQSKAEIIEKTTELDQSRVLVDEMRAQSDQSRTLVDEMRAGQQHTEAKFRYELNRAEELERTLMRLRAEESKE